MKLPRLAAGWAATLVVAAAVAGCGSQTTESHPRPAPPAQSAAHQVSDAVTTPRAVSVPVTGAGLRLTLPRSWTAELWARVPDARLEAWTPQGDLLVSEPGLGRVLELLPRRAIGQPPAQRLLVSGLDGPQGLAFDRVGGREVLYVAEVNEVDRYVWSGGRVGERTVVVPGLPYTAPAGSDDHQLKNVVVGANHRIYVDIGSASNASVPPVTTPPRAAVITYTPSGGGRRVVATGIRNGDGLSFAPDGTLWTAVNERDQIAYPYHRRDGGFTDAYGQVIRSYVNEHPPDELARLAPGRNLGWPYCDPDPDAGGARLRFAELPFTDDQQTNPGGRALDCARLAPLQRGLPAHSAPLGFHFLEGSRLPSPWSHGAVVAVHGSWDRQPPRAPAVLWLPWKSGARTLGAPVTLVGGFQTAGGTRLGRPADAVPGPDGALYVTDDQSGAVYRIVP